MACIMKERFFFEVHFTGSNLWVRYIDEDDHATVAKLGFHATRYIPALDAEEAMHLGLRQVREELNLEICVANERDDWPVITVDAVSHYPSSIASFRAFSFFPADELPQLQDMPVTGYGRSASLAVPPLIRL